MCYPCKSECSATHKTILWRTCPTRLNGQASNTATHFQPGPDHICLERGEVVRVKTLDPDGVAIADRFGRNGDDLRDEPIDGGSPNGIIGRAKRKIIMDIRPAALSGSFLCPCYQNFTSSNSLIARIDAKGVEINFVVRFVFMTGSRSSLWAAFCEAGPMLRRPALIILLALALVLAIQGQPACATAAALADTIIDPDRYGKVDTVAPRLTLPNE